MAMLIIYIPTMNNGLQQVDMRKTLAEHTAVRIRTQVWLNKHIIPMDEALGPDCLL